MYLIFSFQKLLLYLGVFLSVTQGSVIEFNGTPTELKEGLTSSVTLHCGLKDTAASGGIVGRRDVTSTADNVAEVMSLVVMKNGQDIVSVSHSDPPHIMDGSRNIQVSGSIKPSTGERGFIELTFEDPDKNQTGEFVCEVNAMNHSGHVVTFTASLEISTTTPTTADLIQYIRQVNREKDDMKDDIAGMKKEEQGMKQTISDMQKAEREMKSELSELQNKANTVVVFSAGLTKGVTLPVGQVLVYDKVLLNVGGGYNSATGSFVCTVPGYYLFEMSALSLSGKLFGLVLVQNNQDVIRFYGASGHSYQGNSQTAVLKLAKDDIVNVKSYQATSYIHGNPTDMHTTFNGVLVAST